MYTNTPHGNYNILRISAYVYAPYYCVNCRIIIIIKHTRVKFIDIRAHMELYS